MIPYIVILNAALVLNVVALAYYRFSSISTAFFELLVTKSTTTTRSSSRQHQQQLSSIEEDSVHLDKEEQKQYEKAMKRRHSILLYRIYLPVYLLATAADWLQGPYKYAVYSAYGYDQRAISILFVAGFGSGMTLGSIVGGWADTFGRKKMALVYCGCYFLSCLAKHCRPFSMLLIGRVLGGVATSLLFSVFDSWLIRAHSIHKIDKNKYLSESFSTANFGSSVVAILSGLVANAVVESNNNSEDSEDNTSSFQILTTTMTTVATRSKYSSKSNLQPLFRNAARQWFKKEAELFGEAYAGPPTDVNDTRWDVAWIYKGGGIAAFDLALIPLSLCFLLALACWDENYGTDDNNDGDIDRNDIEDNNNRKSGNRSSRASTSSLKKGNNSSSYLLGSLREASITIWRSSGIFNLCAVTSLFEGAMYVFILLWTPVLRGLSSDGEDDDIHSQQQSDDTNNSNHYNNEPPLGIAFATFMVCCMFGTSVFSILSTKMGLRPSRILVFILALSSLSCLVISRASSKSFSSYKDKNNNKDILAYVAMLVFEACIGAYYPAMSTVKGNLVPEDQRDAIYSVFRLPMNLVVLLNLCSNLESPQAFGLCFVMLGVATILQLRVVQWESR